ncbi:MAG: hypothetical protein KAU24_04135 [Candidatus Aenigmarchaeota archaeon]|nr:hypothetical protein [Candidatus Aenigmarchaeota archaeon]
MGEYNLIYMAIGLIIFVGLTVGGKIYLVESMGSAYLEEKTTAEDLDKITVTHLVKDCLMQGNDYMDSDFLDANNGENICDLCEICNIAAEVEVKNLENGKEWSFEYSTFKRFITKVKELVTVWKKERHETHSITVNIKSGDEIHVGELNVKV